MNAFSALQRVPWLFPLILLLPFAAFLAVSLASGLPDLTVSGDEALLEIATRNTAAGRTFTGPYSRFRFHHPGPMYFFLRMPVYYLSGGTASADYAAAALISAVSLLLTAAVIRKSASFAGFLAFCSVAAVYLWALTPDIWLSYWNPFVVIFPVVLTFTALSAASSGRHRLLPLAAASGTFALQTHISTFIPLAFGFAWALVLLLKKSRRGDIRGAGSPKRSLLWTGGILLLLWLPVILHEAATETSGNLRPLAAFFTSTAPEITLKGAAAVWADAVSGMESVFVCGAWARRAGVVLQVKGILVLLRLALLSLMLILLHRRRLRGFPFHLCVSALILHAGTLLSVMLIRGAPHAYLMVWFSAAGLLSWTAIALSLKELLGSTGRAKKMSPAPWVMMALLAVFSILNTASVFNREGGRLYDPLSLHDADLHRLCEALVPELEPMDIEGWRIAPGCHQDWPLMAGLVNCLQKREIQARVTEDFLFMTGVAPDSGWRTLRITSVRGTEETGQPVAESGSLRVFMEPPSSSD